MNVFRIIRYYLTLKYMGMIWDFNDKKIQIIRASNYRGFSVYRPCGDWVT